MAGSSTGSSLISDTKLKQLYATMLQCRLLTQRARRLRSPRRALYSASLGQEAMAAGCVIDLRSEDTVALAPGSSIAGLVKGAELSNLAGQLFASSEQTKLAHNIIGPSSDERAHLQLANHLALANKQENANSVVVAFATAAATASAGWQGALRFAARRALPLIVVVNNKAGLDLHLKAPGNGLTRITVDGNDVVAVYRVAYESLERVRLGDGPVLIEGQVYRQAGETLRRAERDPLDHMERYLKARGLFATRWKDQLLLQFSREIDAAFKTARYLRASPQLAND